MLSLAAGRGAGFGKLELETATAVPVFMFALLPHAAALLLFLWFYRRGERPGLALLSAAALWTCFVYASTELLSLFHAITFVPVAVLWAVATAAGVVLLRRTPAVPLWSRAMAAWRALDLFERSVLVIIALLAACIGVAAWMSPPNTYDVAIYHMPRVMMWLQNRSVEFFPAQYTHALHQPVSNEFLQLHLVLLSGDDVLANCTQWWAWLGVVLAAFEVTRLAGGGRRACFLAALLAATLPQGVLVASSSKNDLSASMWLLSFVVFGLLYRERRDWRSMALAGLCAALAVGTKGTAWLFLPGAGVVVAAAWDKAAWRSFARHGALAAAAFLLLAPQWSRNMALFGRPLLPREGSVDLPHALSVGRVGLDVTAANLIRNFSVHTTLPSEAYSARANEFWRSAVRAIGSNPDDRESIFNDTFTLAEFHWDEVWMPNMPELLLALALAAWSVFRARTSGRLILAFWGCAALGAILFSTLLRWEIWNTRLQQPLFFLAAIPCALVMARWRRPVHFALALLLSPIAIWAALNNDLRPLMGTASVWNVDRNIRYYSDRSWDWLHLTQLNDRLRQSPCRQVGIQHYIDSLNYPFFAELGVVRGEREVRFVDVTNSSARLATPYSPCALVCFSCYDDGEEERLRKQRGSHPKELFEELKYGGHTLFLRRQAGPPQAP